MRKEVIQGLLYQFSSYWRTPAIFPQREHFPSPATVGSSSECQEPQLFSLNSTSPIAGHLFSPEGPAQLVIVHLWFALPAAPEASHFIWILDDKLPILALLPGDDMAELFLLQQFQDEVPQLDLPGAW